ncbi:MAG: RNA-binding S4 domain-containing protein [Eubacterium sp.]|nr:RNA-binding S4 domain-containing protein [Eubacterium sp.]
MDETVSINDEFIKLGQALKLSGLVGSGVEAKVVITDGMVKVNNETEIRRGRKLYPGDCFEYDGFLIRVVKEDDPKDA